jgi:hypothetical protein
MKNIPYIYNSPQLSVWALYTLFSQEMKSLFGFKGGRKVDSVNENIIIQNFSEWAL